MPYFLPPPSYFISLMTTKGSARRGGRFGGERFVADSHICGFGHVSRDSHHRFSRLTTRTTMSHLVTVSMSSNSLRHRYVKRHNNNNTPTRMINYAINLICGGGLPFFFYCCFRCFDAGTSHSHQLPRLRSVRLDVWILPRWLPVRHSSVHTGSSASPTICPRMESRSGRTSTAQPLRHSHYRYCYVIIS